MREVPVPCPYSARSATTAARPTGSTDGYPRTRKIGGLTVQVNALIIDSPDPERLAAFWSTLLGRPIARRGGPYVWLRRDNDLGLGFQRAETRKPDKNRVHLDISSPDPAAEQKRVEALGGRRLEEYAEGGFLVMADPDGNEFCIIPTGAFAIDDEGRADYLD